MIRMSPRRVSSGFTLIEVIIAMFVIALGVGALLTTLASSADSVGRLRDKSLAEWVALNHVSETRLTTPAPGVGVTTGETDFAGSKWRWRQEIIDPEVAGILRIDVEVARAAAKPAQKQVSGTGQDEEFPALAKAYGFLGSAIGAPNDVDPSWSLPAPRGPARP